MNARSLPLFLALLAWPPLLRADETLEVRKDDVIVKLTGIVIAMVLLGYSEKMISPV